MDDSKSAYYSLFTSESSETVTLSGAKLASSLKTMNDDDKTYFPDRIVNPPLSWVSAETSDSRRTSGSTQADTNRTLLDSVSEINNSRFSDPPAINVATKPPSAPHIPPNGCSRCQPPAMNSSQSDQKPNKPRNLVISIDGTSNQFGSTNTNVIELYSQILKEETDEQLTYYDSGIGTYARPSWKSWSYLKQVMHNKIDLAIAWNLEKVIIGAYRWLSNHYRQGDRIFLFGFSRGAFQVRALAGMIDLVGLILPGNESQIPFAYELYANYDPEGKDKDVAPIFKKTFSRTNVRVHFVGVWDTVSSVGFLRGKKMLPRVVDCCNHVCYFRHALALDERRVKFLPEYVHEGLSHTKHEPPFPGQLKCTTDIKEVWFAGSHSDVGGGNRVNKDLQSGDIPLLWMRNEAIIAGLHLKAADINWKSKDLERKPMDSLGAIWQILEQFPMRRLSYKGHKAVSHKPHRGKSRKIVEGQKIHASVIFRPGYRPRPAFPGNLGTWPAPLHWDDPDRHERLNELDEIWEKDLFDYSAVEDLFSQLKNDEKGSARILERIALMASLEEGKTAISRIDSALEILKPFVKREITSVESKLIKINAAAAFSNLIPEEDTTNIDYILKSECLDLAISLLQPEVNQDPENDGVNVKKPKRGATLDIERKIKEKAKAKKDAERSARKDTQKSERSNKKAEKDAKKARSTSKKMTKDVEIFSNAEQLNENIKEPHGDKPIDVKPTTVIEEVVPNDAKELQREANKLCMHASLAVAAFVHHKSLRSTIMAANVPKTLVRLCNNASEDISTASAQALLHMLVFEDVANHVVDEGIATEIIGLVFKEGSNIPVSAARILEELAKWPRTRKVMEANAVVSKLFALLESKSENYIKSSRLDALCHFAKYDDLRSDLLKHKIVPFLIRRTSRQTEKHKRKACLAALIMLAEDETMRDKILKAEFINNLMKQLVHEDTDKDAQSAFVSLAKHVDFRSPIIKAGLIEDIVKRLEKNKTFDDAQDTLAALIEYPEFRKALLESSFILTLENAIVKGGVTLDDLGDAMGSFCVQEDIRQAILVSNFVDTLLNNARGGTMWGMEVAARILRSEFLKHNEIRKQIMVSGLVSMLLEVVHNGSLFALTFVPAILSGVGEYDDMRNPVLDTNIIYMLARRLRHVSLSAFVFTGQYFHDDIDAEFAKHGLDLDDLNPPSLSLSKIFRLGHDNTNMIRSFLYMMATHPRGFVKVLKYGASDDW